MIKEASTTFYMPYEKKTQAQEKAHDLRIPYSEFIRQAIEEKIARMEAKND